MGTIMPDLGMRVNGIEAVPTMAESERESARSGRLKFCLSLEARDHRGRNLRKRAHFLGHQGHVRADGLCSDTLCVRIIHKSEVVPDQMPLLEIHAQSFESRRF
jgi:hypothetical protein